MKLQLWSHFQLRRVHFGATSWFLFAQTFPMPASPPRGDAFPGAQLFRAVLSAIAPARGSQSGGNPGPLPSTSAATLFLPCPLLSLLLSPQIINALPVPAAVSVSWPMPRLDGLGPRSPNLLSDCGPLSSSAPLSFPFPFPFLCLWSVKYNYPITSHHLSTDWSIALTLEVREEGIGASAVWHCCHLEGKARTTAFQGNPHTWRLGIGKETKGLCGRSCHFSFFSKSLLVFIQKARSWGYKGEGMEIKSPLGFKNISQHPKLLLSDSWTRASSFPRQAGWPQVRLNTVPLPRIHSSEGIGKRSWNAAREGACVVQQDNLTRRKHCKGKRGAFSLFSVAVNWSVQFVQDIQDSLTTQFQHPLLPVLGISINSCRGQVAYFNFTGS